MACRPPRQRPSRAIGDIATFSSMVRNLPDLDAARAGEAPDAEVDLTARAPAPALAELAFVRGLWRLAGARATTGNRVKLLVDGPRAFRAMLEAIESARHEILLESYIFASDPTGRRFANACADAARRGVRTRILVDWIGSFETPRSFWNQLRAADADVRIFQRPGFRRWLGLLPRDHRKLLVVDGVIGFTGGFGLADAWSVGDDDMGEASGGRWRDTGVRIAGPAALEMRASFRRMWRRAGSGNDLEEAPAEPDAPLHPDTSGSAHGAIVGIVEGLPLRMRTERGFHYQTAIAGSSIWIANAYFIPARPQIEALCLAAKDGVDVRILVPAFYDHPWTRRYTRRTYRRLLAAGVRIWEWQGPMMHAKTHVVDEHWVRVGSTDLNPLGVVVNHELDAAIFDADLGAEAAEVYLRDLKRSKEISAAP